VTDSNNELDPGLEMANIHTASGEIDDMHNISDTEDISHPWVRTGSLGQETIPGAGRHRGEVAGYTEINLAMTDDPWSPFSSKDNFNLASGFVRGKVASTHTLLKVWVVRIADHAGPPIPCDNISTY